MGRTAAVTFEMVSSAAEAMKADGLTVTVRSVRERLGNIGSFGTVNAHVSVWKERQEQHVVSALTLPPALQKSMLDFIGTELARERQVLELSIADKKQQIADLTVENNKQTDELDDNAELLDTLRNEIATLNGKAGQLEIDLAASKEEVIHDRVQWNDEIGKERASAESARTELAKAQLKLEAMPRLESDLNAVRLALETEHTGKVSAEQAAAVAIAKMEAANDRIQELHDRLAKAEASSIKAQEKIDAAAKEAGEARSALETERVAKVLSEQTVAVAIAKMEAGNQRIEELCDRLAKAEANNIKLQEKIDAAAQNAVTLNALVQSATKEIEVLKNAKIDAEVALAALVVKVEPTKTKGKPGPKPKQAPTETNDTDKETDSQTIPLELQE